MKKYRNILIFLFAIFFLSACGAENSETNTGSEGGSKETVTITHELGETVVQKIPEKIVVFDFGTIDTLDKMGIEVTGLPKSGTVPPYLSKYEDDAYINVGSLKEPDFEKISEIDPDLIIISARQQELYEEFKKIAPTIFVGLDTSDYINSFKVNVEKIAQIFDKEDFVKKELDAIDEKIAEVKEKVEGSGKDALIILANEGKVSAYGPGSRFGLIHDVLGFTPVDENIEASTHGQSISFEFIVEKNPDYLFVIDRTAVVGGEANAKEVVENELVQNTNAYKDGNIVYLDPNYWYLSGGGLVSVAEMVDEIAESLE